MNLYSEASRDLVAKQRQLTARKAALLDQLVESNLLLIDRSIYPVDGKIKTAVLLAELMALYPDLDSVRDRLREAGVMK